MLSVKENLISFSNPKRPVILPVRASEMPGVNLIIEPVWMGENYYLPASVILPRIGKIGDPNIIPLNDHRAFVGIRTPLPGYVRTEKDLAQFLGTQAAMELVWETIDKVNESKYPHKSGCEKLLLQMPCKISCLFLRVYIGFVVVHTGCSKVHKSRCLCHACGAKRQCDGRHSNVYILDCIR